MDLSDVRPPERHNSANEVWSYLTDKLISNIKTSLLQSNISIILPQTDNWEEVFTTLLITLGQSKASLVIDEYDAMLTHAMAHPNQEVFTVAHSFLSQFLLLLKKYGHASSIHMVFITGITRYLNQGDTGFNNYKDISCNPKYASLVGFMESEIRHYFAPHLENAAQVLSRKHNCLYSAEDILAKMRDYYNRYNFAYNQIKASTLELIQSQRVYNPISVLSFLQEPELGIIDYWPNTGRINSFVRSTLEKQPPEALLK